MDEKTMEKNQEIEIDLQRLLGAVLNKAWLIGIVAIVCAVATLVGTLLLVTPTYQSSIKLYVNNKSGDSISGSLTSGDISAARAMVKAYIIILNTKETMEEVVEYAGLDLTYSQVEKMVTAGAVDSTEIIEVVVTSTDPAEAETIANAIASVLPKKIDSIIDGTSAKIVDTAVRASSPSAPSYTKNTLIGFLVGFLVVVAVIVLREIFDVTVRTEEDVQRSSKHPILAAVPDMEAHGKGSRYYGYRKAAYDKTKLVPSGKKELIGADISFAASEAYKLLRTKLQFSFTDERNCHVIGVSSAMTGEGKSLTTVNLAYSLSQLGERVLLIDCDMRRPSIADKLPIQKYPGLSDYLSGQARSENLIQLCGLKDDESAFHVISAGRMPPNPMELLSSNKMEKTITALRESYDYIILDLPPVGEVGDALAVAKLTDGMLLVSRQDYCNRLALTSAIRQFEFVNAKILGMVFNCAKEDNGGYGKKYYKKYGYRYYAKAYKRSAEKANNQQA